MILAKFWFYCTRIISEFFSPY